MNYLYFDNNRAIKSRNFEKLYASSNNADYLYVFADFDASTPSAYTVTARFIRADGFIIGELPLEAVTENNPLTNTSMRAHKLVLDSEILKVPGSLSVTISFNKTLDNVPITMTTGMATATVYNSVPLSTRENAQIQAIMRMVQNIANTVDTLDPSTQEITVTFVWNDGTVTTSNIDSMSSVLQPTTKTRSGYTFIGWYSDAGLTSAYSFSTKLSSDTILYAKWNVNSTSESELPNLTTDKVRITYVVNGGTEVQAKTVDKDSAFDVASTTKDGYVFEGWYDRNGIIRYDTNYIVTDNLIVYAKWSYVDTVKVTFMFGEEIYAVVNVDKGGLLYYGNRPYDPIKEGYTFMGWYTAANNGARVDFGTWTFNSNRTLYAVFTAKLLMATIHWPNENPEEIYNIAYNTLFSQLGLVTPAIPEGREFEGWFAPNKLFRYYPSYKITDDIDVYPEFYIINVGSSNRTVTFESNGGSDVESQSIAYGGTVTSPTAPTKTGFTFLGWYKDTGLINAWDFANDKVGSSDITLYAKWTATTSSTYSIRFIANGEVLKTVTKTVGANLSSSDLPTNPIKDGYTFAWWYYRNNNAKRFAITDSFTTSSIIDIVARWQTSTTTTANVTCPICDGIGTRTGLFTCDTCRGDERVTCGVCGGNGYVNNDTGHGCSADADDAVECSACGGNGLIDCPECEGAGHVYKENVKCTRCAGTGTINETNISYTYTFDTL